MNSEVSVSLNAVEPPKWDFQQLRDELAGNPTFDFREVRINFPDSRFYGRIALLSPSEAFAPKKDRKCIHPRRAGTARASSHPSGRGRKLSSFRAFLLEAPTTKRSESAFQLSCGASDHQTHAFDPQLREFTTTRLPFGVSVTEIVIG
jgi:hypothetical protein